MTTTRRAFVMSTIAGAASVPFVRMACAAPRTEGAPPTDAAAAARDPAEKPAA